MSAALQSFIYEAEAVRVVVVEDKPWWVAADVALRLGYSRSADMVRMLSDHQKGVHKVRTPGGEQSLTVISEGGLFKCILRSKRPEAEKFGDWVTDELLPTLRRTGRYDMAANDDGEDLSEALPEEAEALRVKLAIAREARVVFGVRRARQAWKLVGLLPELTDGLEERASGHLGVPQAVAELARSVCDWMDARTEAVAGHREGSQDLYNNYLDWAKAEEIPQSEVVHWTAFGRALTNMGIGSVRSNRVYRVGLRLVR